MADFDSYIICTSPRSGSTLLCKLLEKTALVGVPESYFHQPSLASWAAGVGLAGSGAERISDIIDAINTVGRGQSDLFGLRLQRHSFAFFMGQLGRLHPDLHTDAARLSAVFGRVRYIHLTRENKLDQAISVVKAQQTGLWHIAPDGHEIERLSSPAPLVYDGYAIATKKAAFEAADEEWTAWFEQQNMSPLRITYSELAQAPREILAHVLSDLGCDPRVAYDISVSTAKLANETSREWAKRFAASDSST
jgi:LPS sulfotransferase NodH